MNWDDIIEGAGTQNVKTDETELIKVWNGQALARDMGIRMRYVRTQKNHVLVLYPTLAITHINNKPREINRCEVSEELTEDEIQRISQQLEDNPFDEWHEYYYTIPCPKIRDLRLLTVAPKWCHKREDLKKWAFAAHLSLQHATDTSSRTSSQAFFQCKGKKDLPGTFLLPYHTYLFLATSLFAKNQHFLPIKRTFLGLSRSALDPPTGRADATINNPLTPRHIGKAYVGDEMIQALQGKYNKAGEYEKVLGGTQYGAFRVWTENMEEMDEETEVRGRPDEKRCKERKLLAEKSNGILQYPNGPSLKDIMKFLLPHIQAYQKYDTILVMTHDQKPEQASNEWMKRALNLAVQRCCIEAGTNTAAERKHGVRGGSGQPQHPKYEKWGILMVDAKRLPGWQHQVHPPHWLCPIVSIVLYMACKEAKTIIAFDNDVINTGLLSWEKAEQILCFHDTSA